MCFVPRLLPILLAGRAAASSPADALPRGVMGGGVAVVCVEGRAVGPARRRRVVDREPDQRHESQPVVGALAVKGAQDVGDDAVDAFDLACSVLMVWRARRALYGRCA